MWSIFLPSIFGPKCDRKFEKHSDTWVSYGSATSARDEQQKDESYDGLTVHQLKILDALVRRLKDENKSMTVSELVEATEENPTKITRITVNKTLNRLAKLGFALLRTLTILWSLGQVLQSGSFSWILNCFSSQNQG